MEVKTRTLKSDLAHEVPKWELGYLEVTVKEGKKLLTEAQYAHVVQLFEELAYESDPTKSKTQDVRNIQEFYELRDKGGVLGNINLRVYFSILTEKKRNMILVLAVDKKEDEAQAPQHIITRVRHRLRIAKEIIEREKQKG